MHSDLNMTKGNPASIILRFTIPIMIGSICQQLYNMVDTIIVGRFVGQNALAAVGSTGNIMFLVIGFSIGLAAGFSILTSHCFGAGDEKGVKESAANAILLCVVIALALAALSCSLMHPLLHLMNTPDEIYADAYSYVIIMCGGMFFLTMYNLAASLLRAVGNSRMPLISLVCSSCLNILLDLVFIIVFHLGTAGAALATIVSQAVSALICVLYVVFRLPILKPDRGMWHFYPQHTRSQIGVGLPMALQYAITASGTIIMQSAINLCGATAVAAITAASKIINLLSQGCSSIGQTMAAYVGQNYGARAYERIRAGVRSASLMISVYCVLTGILSYVLLEPLMGLFFSAGTDMAAMMPYARTYTGFCAVLMVALGNIYVLRNSMQGCGYGLIPTMGGVVELFCRGGFAIASMLTGSYVLACMCDPAAWLGACIYAALAYRYVIRQVKKTLRPSETAGA